MAFTKKNGDLDMRYNSSKEKARKRHKWEIIGTIIAIIILIINGLLGE